MDAYRFSGFTPRSMIKGKFGDQTAFVVSLKRRSKKVFAAGVAEFTEPTTIKGLRLFVTCLAVIDAFISNSRCDEWIVSGAAR